MDFHVILSGNSRGSRDAHVPDAQREFVIRDQEDGAGAVSAAMKVAEASGMYNPRVVNVRPYADQHTRM